MEKDTARPGSKLGSDAWGNCGDVEAASLRRDRKPARVEAAARLFQAVPQAWRKGQSAWRTPTRASRTKRKTHSVPGVQRKKRSTPTAEQVSSGRSDQLQPPDGCPAEEGLITPTHWTRPRTKGLSLRPSARAACEGLNHFALAAFPRGRPCGTTRAEGLTPRFLGRETLEKPDNDLSITPPSTRWQGFRGLAAQSVRSSSV